MRDQQILISDLLVVFLFFMVVYFVWNLIMAKTMEKIARQKGYGEEFNAFMMCFWLGMIGCLYVIALPDLKQREQLDRIIKLLDPQVPTNPPRQDVAWKFQKPTPETPKGDGSAEAYLHKIGKSPEEYMCTTLVVTTMNTYNKCSVCQQKEKTIKLCRLVQKDAVKDIPICTECINAFIEYNPKSVFDLETKETE